MVSTPGFELCWEAYAFITRPPLHPTNEFFQLMFSLFVQPAAKKGADKSGPGAGISVLSEKALFLGQKVRTSLLSLLKTN